MSDGGGLRYDEGKTRYDLIPPEWEQALAEVLTAGAAKYAERNWERGMAWSKCVGCVRRHIFKWLRGEQYDDETGCHHLAHAAWNLLALMSYQLRDIGADDLPRPKLGSTRRFPPRSSGKSYHEVKLTPGQALDRVLKEGAPPNWPVAMGRSYVPEGHDEHPVEDAFAHDDGA